MRLGLRDFTGTWRVARRVLPETGAEARFEGQAWLTPDEHGLSYHEDGLLSLPGHAPIRAERRYLWRDAPDGGITVLFQDGRAFHGFDPNGKTPGDRHFCDPDTYVVSYDFAGWPVWRSDWRVRGPRKDYRMITDYERIPGARTGP